MAERELSILVRAKGALAAAQQIGKVDSAVGRLGRTAARGAATAGANIAKIGLIAAGGIAIGVKGGIESLAQLESAVSSVDAAAKQMGTAFESGGIVTGARVAQWANEIERAIGAAFDDKDIVQATTTLIRFGNTTAENLRPAMEVMTDLATKTGSVDSAASLLAKALADPTKAAGKLARAGVILTKEQQEQIKAFVAAGKVGQAQKVILDSLAQSTKGAALASQGPYQRSLSTLKDVVEDAQRALAEGFLPVIMEVRDVLSRELAKPETIQKIKEFGQGLATGLRGLIETAKALPWAQIGDSLKIAGAGAKAVWDAFTGLPPWIQGAVLTGWGLNKLTGGALGTIVGELGKGLIKGVLGMTAGVVNINAASVNAGGVPVAGGKGGGLLGTIGKAFLPVAIVGITGQAVLELAEALNPPGSRPSDYTRMGGNGTRGFVPPTAKQIGQEVGTYVRQGLAPDERTAQTKLDAIRRSAEANRIAIVSAIRGIRMSVTIPITVRSAYSVTRVTSYASGTTVSHATGTWARGAELGA